MRNYFTLDGTDSRSFGVFISGQGTFNGPARALEYISVPGRNGDLIRSNTRLQNGTLTYPAFIYSNFRANIAALRAFLTSASGYRRLEDSYHPEEYRKAVFRGPLEVSATNRNDAGSFNLSFDVMPQRFLLSGETTVVFTTSASLTNPTLYKAQPLLRVYGKGTFWIGGTSITVAGHNYSYVDIDCETGRAYYGATALDNKISLSVIDYPTLKPGANGISLGSGITRIEITPRWWKV